MCGQEMDAVSHLILTLSSPHLALPLTFLSLSPLPWMTSFQREQSFLKQFVLKTA